MDDEDLSAIARRERWRARWIAVALAAGALWGLWQFLHSATPRRIVLASGPADGFQHELALRYKEILARDGVAVEERMTAGGAENAALLHDPASGVDVAFVPAGVATPDEARNLVMLASLAYEPIWVFYRGPATLTQIDELQSRRIAIGTPGQGTRALSEPLLAANGITHHTAELLPLGNRAALRALQAGEIDAALFSGPASTAVIQQALLDPSLKLMSLARAEAYSRRVAYLTRLTLPPGTIDLALHVPAHEVQLIGTATMLVARDGLPTPLAHLLYDAALEIHSGQGIFEAKREFPNTDPLDIAVSEDAYRHHRFGPSYLNRVLPFWAATLAERLIVIMLPLIVILVPLVNLLPQLVRWRVRRRIYRWYGELALLERDVEARTGTLPVDRWLATLDRIQRAVERLRTPSRFGSETYTLREHIALVRNAVLAKSAAAAVPAKEAAQADR